MSEEVAWVDDAHTIFVLRYPQPLTWDDFEAVIGQAQVLLADHNAPVFAIHIFADFPHDATSIPLVRAIETTPGFVVGAAVVPAGSNTSNAAVRAFVGIAARVYPGKLPVLFARSLEEALEIARHHLAQAGGNDQSAANALPFD